MVPMGQIKQTLSDARILLTGCIRFPYCMTTAGTSSLTLWAPQELPLKHDRFLKGKFQKMIQLLHHILGDYIFRSTIKRHRYTVTTGLPCTQHLTIPFCSPEMHPDGIHPGTSFSDEQSSRIVPHGSCQKSNRGIAPDLGGDHV